MHLEKLVGLTIVSIEHDLVPSPKVTLLFKLKAK